MPATEPLPLRLEGLRVEAAGRVLLDIPALSLAPGGLLALRGASGAGKTTALNALAGIAIPTAGRVLWGSTDLAALAEPARRAFRRRHIGLIFQDYRLFDDLTALENAALAAGFIPAAERRKLHETAATALDRMGLGPARDRRIAVMSGGERQRVAVARALAAGPAVVLADEPTAALDRANADRLGADLAALAGSRTVVIVSHDPALLSRASRVLTLDGGRIVEDIHA